MMTKFEVGSKDFEIILSTLDDLVPEDHIVRKYQAAIDWSFIYPLVEKTYSKVGKPSVDPVILFKLVLLNYLEGFHSMRKTCEKCSTDVAYRWFLGLNFTQKIPDHSTFSKNLSRKFLDTHIFDEIFHRIIKEAFKSGFINEENVFGDTTHVKASANKKKHIKQIIKETEKIYKEDLIRDINLDREVHGKKPIKDDSSDDDDHLPPSPPLSTDELLKTNDSEEIMDSEIDESGEVERIVTFDPETGELKEKNTKQTYKTIKASVTDPDSGYYHKGEHEKVFAYSVGAISDTNGFILATHVDSGNLHDSVTFFGLWERYRQSFLYENTKLMCFDAGYTSPAIEKKVIDAGKEILLPYVRPKTKDGFFKKYDFVYDEKLDVYLCPNHQELTYRTTNREGYRQYHSDSLTCQSCPFLSKCTRSKNHVKVIVQHVWYDYQEITRETRYKMGYKEIYNHRKETIERAFADGKENSGLRFTRYRGMKRVTMSMLLTFSSMNLKKLARWKGKGLKESQQESLISFVFSYFSSLRRKNSFQILQFGF